MTPKERTAMQQALEVLRLAKNSHGIMLMSDPPKDAWRFHDVNLKLVAAITALREALDHSGEVNEMVGCAYCNNLLFAGTKCNNCGRVTLADSVVKDSLTAQV